MVAERLEIGGDVLAERDPEREGGPASAVRGRHVLETRRQRVRLLRRDELGHAARELPPVRRAR